MGVPVNRRARTSDGSEDAEERSQQGPGYSGDALTLPDYPVVFMGSRYEAG